jgi:hypothetical protein
MSLYVTIPFSEDAGGRVRMRAVRAEQFALKRHLMHAVLSAGFECTR